MQCTSFWLRWPHLWGTGSRGCGLQQLWYVGSAVGCTGLAALRHVGILPEQGSSLVSCAGRWVLTTEPPGKPKVVTFSNRKLLRLDSQGEVRHGNSLAVQCLGLLAFTAEVQSLVREVRFPQATQRGQKTMIVFSP